MSKYQKYVQGMIDEHKELFESFQKIHDAYVANPDEVKSQFNTQGAKVVEVIRQWERMLCQKSEASQYGKYSQNLSEKFWNAVRGQFPKIDFVGVK